MKVFLSWSGEASKAAALTLHTWLPSVIHTLKPFMSAESIEKGERWSVDIARQLEETHYGIICVTPENISAPWILFEAGALSKSMDRSKVSPILFSLSPSDLSGSPLLQFQSTEFKKDDIRKLLLSLNTALPDDNKLSLDILNKSFDRGWDELEADVSKISFNIKAEPAKIKKNEDEVTTKKIESVLEELLTITRSQIKMLRSPEDILPPNYLKSVLNEIRQIPAPGAITSSHPAWRAANDCISKIKSILRDESIASAPSNLPFTMIGSNSLHNDLMVYIEELELHLKFIRRNGSLWRTSGRGKVEEKGAT
ncbi:TIR domain-containing protein [Azospirillum argentinense]|uniref:TIR domain-containing protein n=1 Tax=Azospirillum argentinense TaxID=2970906 RepID=A0A4D8PAM9_9PROT|nr:TIR domain-containing protein [Azospirillum argentinense]QCN95873.1 TIR domain-containing protein [Azospirillum argentinense]